jgi:hypothetical protein
VVVYDEASDSQDKREISKLAATLSKQLACPLLVVLSHDDDILWYQRYLGGSLTDQYNSDPDRFETVATYFGPTGGDAAKVCAAFGGDTAEVEKVLRQEDYVFAFQRHAALVDALGISDYAVGTAYGSFYYNELPDGLSADEVIEVN